MARAAAAGRDVAGAARDADRGKKQGFSAAPLSSAATATGEEWGPLMAGGCAESLREVSLAVMLARPGSGALGTALSSYRSTKLKEVDEVEYEPETLTELENFMPDTKSRKASSSGSQPIQGGNQPLGPFAGGADAASEDGPAVQTDMEDSELGGYRDLAMGEDTSLSESSIGSSTDITPNAGGSVTMKGDAAPPDLPAPGVLSQPLAVNAPVDLRLQPSSSINSSLNSGGRGGGSGAPWEVTLPSEQIDLVMQREAGGRVAGPEQAMEGSESAGSESLGSATAPSRSWRQFMPHPTSFRREQPALSSAAADDGRGIRAAPPAAPPATPPAAPQTSVLNVPPLPSLLPVASFYVDAGFGRSLVPQSFRKGGPMTASPGKFAPIVGGIFRFDKGI